MKIEQLFKSKINLFALAFCAISSGFWMIVVAQRYYCFLDTLWHHAYYAQNLWDILHGHCYSSLLGANFMANHCSFLCFLFAPLYALLPDPVLLQYLKIWGFFAGAYVFFLILKKHFNPWIALAAMIVFTLAPANKTMLLGVFSYEPFSIPLIFLIFKALDDRQYQFFIISCFFLAMVKEQMPLLVMMFGVFALFFIKEDKIKWALVPLLLGLVIFIVDVFILVPYVRSGLRMEQSYFWHHYSAFGRTPQAILSFLLLHPQVVLQKILCPNSIQWYKNLFGLGGILALGSPQILLIATPLFLKNILSSFTWEHEIVYYYAATFTPFIFLASMNTLNYVKNKARLPLQILFIMVMFVNSFSPIKGAPNNPPFSINKNILINQRLIDKIPPQASVLSAWRTMAPLANRQELYAIKFYLAGIYGVSERKFKMPEHLQYILLDTGFEQEYYYSKTPQGLADIAYLNFSGDWDLIESIENMALYVKTLPGKNPRRLIEKSLQPFAKSMDEPALSVEDTLILKGMDFPQIFPNRYRIFPITMDWQCLKKPEIPYEILLRITSKRKTCYFERRNIGSGIWPTNLWEKGEYIKEKYFYLLDHLIPGEYSMEISFYSQNKSCASLKRKFLVTNNVPPQVKVK